MRIIWQTVRRNTNEILGVKGLAKVLGLYLKLRTKFYLHGFMAQWKRAGHQSEQEKTRLCTLLYQL